MINDRHEPGSPSGSDPEGLADPRYGVDPVRWRGVTLALLAAPPSLEVAAGLLEHAGAGFLFSSLADRRRALRARADVSSAAAQLEWAGLVGGPPPRAVAASAGPVSWAEVRAVLTAAIGLSLSRFPCKPEVNNSLHTHAIRRASAPGRGSRAS
jgi:hypothetical protein